MARVGIIGTGWGLRAQAPGFRAAGLDVVAIAGRDPRKTASAVENLDGVRAALTWRHIVDADDVDLVSIVTPPDLHLEMTLAALENGKHVLCEKPMALDAAQAATMVKAARRHPGQIAIIDHELRFLPSHQEAKRRLPDLGPVRYAEARYSSPGRADRARAWNWWSNRAQGGGIWGAVGSHLVDTLRRLIGEIDSVQGHLHTFVKGRPFDDEIREVTSDDYASVNLRFRNDAAAILSMSAVAGVDEPTTFTLHGEKGSMRLVNEKLFWSTAGVWEEISIPSTAPVSGDTAGGRFGSGTVHLGRALVAALDRDDGNAIAAAATFDDGAAVQRVLDAARRSHDDGGSWRPIDSTP